MSEQEEEPQTPLVIREAEDQNDTELIQRFRNSKIETDVQLKLDLKKPDHKDTNHGKIINSSYRTGYIPTKLSTPTKLFLDYIFQTYDLAVYFKRLEERLGGGQFDKVSEIFQSEIDGFLDISVSIGGQQQKWFFEPKLSKESTLTENRASGKSAGLFGLNPKQ